LASTPVTTAVIVPEKSFVFSVVPAPAELIVVLPAALALANELAENSGSAVMPAATLPLLASQNSKAYPPESLSAWYSTKSI